MTSSPPNIAIRSSTTTSTKARFAIAKLGALEAENRAVSIREGSMMT